MKKARNKKRLLLAAGITFSAGLISATGFAQQAPSRPVASVNAAKTERAYTEMNLSNSVKPTTGGFLFNIMGDGNLIITSSQLLINSKSVVFATKADAQKAADLMMNKIKTSGSFDLSAEELKANSINITKI